MAALTVFEPPDCWYTWGMVQAWRLWVLVGLVALAAGYLMWGRSSTTELASAYEWQFIDRGEKDYIPQTEVELLADGRRHSVGTYNGSCSVVEGEYLEYETSKVVCWYAGGGHEIGVFEEPGQVVVRVGEVDEGASGIPGFRGNFKLLKVIQ